MSRVSAPAAKLQQPADASATIGWRHRSTEGPMPEVHNDKSQAKDLYDGARKGRGGAPVPFVHDLFYFRFS